MHLDHINLCASDVPELTRTMTRHFGYTVLQEGTVPNYPGAPNPGDAFSFLLGQDGSYIVIPRSRPQLQVSRPTHRSSTSD